MPASFALDKIDIVILKPAPAGLDLNHDGRCARMPNSVELMVRLQDTSGLGSDMRLLEIGPLFITENVIVDIVQSVLSHYLFS